jgi:hypothetical protein
MKEWLRTLRRVVPRVFSLRRIQHLEPTLGESIDVAQTRDQACAAWVQAVWGENRPQTESLSEMIIDQSGLVRCLIMPRELVAVYILKHRAERIYKNI